MRENVGGVDRVARAVAGPALLAGGAMLLLRRKHALGAMATAAGAMLGQTAVTRVCPVNRALGIDTR